MRKISLWITNERPERRQIRQKNFLRQRQSTLAIITPLLMNRPNIYRETDLVAPDGTDAHSTHNRHDFLKQIPVRSKTHQSADQNDEAFQLHNVRNLISHLRLVVAEINEQHEHYSAKPIQQVASVLANSTEDLIQHQSIGEHLESLAASIEAERNNMTDSLEILSSTVEDLTQIVTQNTRSTYQKEMPIPFPLSDLIEEVIQQSRSRLELQAIKITTLHRTNTRVKSDRNLLRQVLTNLIVNSEQSFNETKIDSKRITIESSSHDGWVTLSVVDNGCGIPESRQPNIMDFGYTTKQSGTGIGLAYCEETMHQLHGYMEIESDGIGYGTSVTLHLPAV